MAKKKKNINKSLFENLELPATVTCVAQPVRNEIEEGQEYAVIDKYEFNNKHYLVILCPKGRELYFEETYFA